MSDHDTAIHIKVNEHEQEAEKEPIDDEDQDGVRIWFFIKMSQYYNILARY